MRKRTHVKAYERRTGHVRDHDRGYEAADGIQEATQEAVGGFQRSSSEAKDAEKERLVALRAVTHWEYEDYNAVLLDENGEVVDTVSLDSLIEQWLINLQRDEILPDAVDWDIEDNVAYLRDEQGAHVDTLFLDDLVSHWLAEMVKASL